MGLRRRILRVLELGPRKRTVLSGLARGSEDFATTFQRLLARGEIVMRGNKKGATYALSSRTTPRRNVLRPIETYGR